MQAVRAHSFGDPDVLVLEEVPDPEPGPGQVLIRLEAAGINPVDTYIRSGSYGRLPVLPYIPGSDGAGTVIAVGSGTTKFRTGHRVYVAGAPTYCGLTVADEDHVWPLPINLTFEQGAAIGVPYLTAYRAIHFVGRGRPGDRVLVHGASGGVGVAAMQIGGIHGMHMVGTAGTEEGLSMVENLGFGPAFHHDQLEEAFERTGGNGFDLVLEMAAHLSLGRVLPFLARGGKVVVIGSRSPVEINPRDLMEREASVVGMMRHGGGKDDIARMHLGLRAGFASGHLSPVIGRRFPLAQAADAHRAVLEPGALGKIVLTI